MRRGRKPLPDVCVHCAIFLQCRWVKRECERWKRKCKKIMGCTNYVHKKRTPQKIKMMKELNEIIESAHPPWETFEEDLEPLSERRPEQNEVSEK